MKTEIRDQMDSFHHTPVASLGSGCLVFGFDPQMTLKRKTNSFNKFVVIYFVENEVLHKNIGLLF